MKDFCEAIMLMVSNGIINPKEAHEIYLKAIRNWLEDEIHHHELEEEVN
jgi:hypothetical protein